MKYLVKEADATIALFNNRQDAQDYADYLMTLRRYVSISQVPDAEAATCRTRQEISLLALYRHLEDDEKKQVEESARKMAKASVKGWCQLMVEKVDYVSVLDGDKVGAYLTLDGQRLNEGDTIQIASLEHPEGLNTTISFGNPKQYPCHGWYFTSAPGLNPEGVFARWV